MRQEKGRACVLTYTIMWAELCPARFRQAWGCVDGHEEPGQVEAWGAGRGAFKNSDKAVTYPVQAKRQHPG